MTGSPDQINHYNTEKRVSCNPRNASLQGLAEQEIKDSDLDLARLLDMPGEANKQNAPGRKGPVSRWEWRSKLLLLATFLTLCFGIICLCNNDMIPYSGGTERSQLCPQPAALKPTRNSELWDEFGHDLQREDFRKKAVDWLAGSIKIPTESYDNQEPPGVDPRWEIFDKFHKYLSVTFPLTFSKLAVTTVNTYGLVFHWEGSDDRLRPCLLAAHQDVVPVDPETVNQWDYPPYSGHFDGESIWGRGSADDKNALIAILTVFETFLDKGFRPTRTIVAAFGFDEESAGKYGAGALAQFLEQKYGRDSFAFIADEGGSFNHKYGADFATPAIAEKGYVDMHVRVEGPGGHSSIAPAHTTIGILAALLVQYENNPTPLVIDRINPVYGMVTCFAARGPSLNKGLRKLIYRSSRKDEALHRLENAVSSGVFGSGMKSLFATTQAIDLISGGVKVNALPEEATAVINHRIAVTSSVDQLIQHSTSVLKDVARDYNLSFTAFGKNIVEGPSLGRLSTSDAFGTMLEPAPIAPTDAAPYILFSGTIRATYDAHRGIKEGERTVVVSPGVSSGNTDTRYYWDLSKHIYRYGHRYSGTAEKTPGVHTVNERIPLGVYLEILRFFSTLILNADEAKL